MRTIVKKWIGNNTLYHESYDNYMEFYDTLMARQPNAYQKIESVMRMNSSSWIGVGSVDEAKNLFLNGWERPLEQMKVQVDNQLRTLENKRKTKTFNNVCGFMPIIPNALMRLPNSMIDTRVQKVKSKVLRFLICIDRAGGTGVDEIITKMSKQLAYISMLERSGQYRCRIEVFGTGYTTGFTKSVSCSVLVKSENQLFDVKRLCYPVINPSMLRLLFFAWYDSVPISPKEYHSSGYGKSFEWWSAVEKKAFVDAINENGENVICLDLNSNMEEVLRKGGMM